MNRRNSRFSTLRRKLTRSGNKRRESIKYVVFLESRKNPETLWRFAYPCSGCSRGGLVSVRSIVGELRAKSFDPHRTIYENALARGVEAFAEVARDTGARDRDR